MRKLFAFAFMAVLLLTLLAGALAQAEAPGLTLGDEMQTLFLGKSKTLRPRMENTRESASYTYASGNEAVAAVTKSGVVKGLSIGEATITCTAATKSGTYEASVKVRVIKPVSGVKLGKALIMASGTVYPLKAEIRPQDATDRSLTWSSSRESVVTVDANGVLAAHAAGSATITALSMDGSKKRATLQVTVKDFQAVIRSREGTLLPFTPGSGMFSITHAAKQGRVGTASGGEGNTLLFTPLAPGTDTVTLTLTEYLSKEARKSKYEVYVTPAALMYETNAQALAAESAVLTAGLKQVYEFAYEIRHENFSVFLLIDTDEKTVRRFATNDTTILPGKYKGKLEESADVQFLGGKARVSLRFAKQNDPAVLIMRDMDGVDWAWQQTEVARAAAVLGQGKHTVITKH